MSSLGTRWQPSVVTFGPLGRLVVTAVLVLVPIGVLARTSFFGLPFVGLWCFVVLPIALRDLWQRLRAPMARSGTSRRRGGERQKAKRAQPPGATRGCRSQGPTARPGRPSAP